MGYQEDLFGYVYKSEKTKAAAAKRKKKNEETKAYRQQVYDQALSNAAQDWAKKNNFQYDNKDTLRDAAKAYYENTKARESFDKWSNKQSASYNKKLTKDSASFMANKENKSKIDEYNKARKSMGLQADNQVTANKYKQMFGNEKTGDLGMLKRYSSSEDYKKNYAEEKKKQSLGYKTDQTIDKGLNKLGDILQSIKKGVNKVEGTDIGKNLKNAYGKEADVLKGLYNSSLLKKKVDVGKKVLEVDEKYSAAPTRNIISSAQNKQFQPIKDIKEAISGERRVSGEQIAKDAGIKSKYGAKVAGLLIEGVADPAGIVGGGVAKLGAKTLAKVTGKTTAEDALKVLQKTGKVSKGDAKKIRELANTKKIADEAAQQTPNITEQLPVNQNVPTAREMNLQNINLPKGKIKVANTQKKSLNDLIGRNANEAPVALKEGPNEPTVTPKQAFEQQVQQITPQTPVTNANIPSVNATPTENLQTAVNIARDTGDFRPVLDNTDNLIKELDVHKGDEELDLLKDEMNGLKLNLQTFAGTPEQQAQLLKQIERVNKQADTLLRSRTKAENLKGMSIPDKKAYDVARHTTDLEHLQTKLDDLNALENSSIGGQLSPQVAELKANLENRINRKQAMLSEAQKPLTQSEQFRTQADDFLNNNDEVLKDMSMLELNRETPSRISDATGGVAGKEMYDTFFKPTQIAETERIDKLNEIGNQFKTMQKDLKISKKDDELIQKFGEKEINLDELKQQTNNWQNVVTAVEQYRKLYDELLTNINESLVRNGYDPIPKRKDYFPHYNKKGNVFTDLFGIDMTNHKLPTDINGMTDTFRPGKQWTQFAQQRLGKQTSYGALEGLSNYLNGATNLIYHTDNIKRIRSLEDAVRAKYKGTDKLSNFSSFLRQYGDQLSGKKGVVDRAIEGFIGRKAYNLFSTITGNASTAAVGGNLTSALSGFIPVSTALATTGKAATLKALKDTVASTIKNDGFTTPFMKRRMGTDPLYLTKFGKAKDKAFWLMKQVDNFSTNLIVRSKYNELIKKGLSPEDAVKGADEYAARVMADRSKGQVPLAFNQRVLSPLTQFQLEVNNQVSHIIKDIPSMAKASTKTKAGVIAKTTGYLTQLAVYGWLYNQLSEKVTGRRMAFDPIEYATKAFKGDSLGSFKDIAGQIPGSSVVFQGRSPMDNIMPDFSGALKNAETKDSGFLEYTGELGKEALSKAPYAAGIPGYGQLKKTVEGVKAAKQGYSSTPSGNIRYAYEGGTGENIQNTLFGQYAPKEAQQYFDLGLKPLQGKRAQAVAVADDKRKEYLNQQIAKVESSEKNASGDKLKKLEKQLKALKKDLKDYTK